MTSSSTPDHFLEEYRKLNQDQQLLVREVFCSLFFDQSLDAAQALAPLPKTEDMSDAEYVAAEKNRFIQQGVGLEEAVQAALLKSSYSIGSIADLFGYWCALSLRESEEAYHPLGDPIVMDPADPANAMGLDAVQRQRDYAREQQGKAFEEKQACIKAICPDIFSSVFLSLQRIMTEWRMSAVDYPFSRMRKILRRDSPS